MPKKRRFRIDSGRYGAELTIGEVDKDFVDYFIGKRESDLIDTVLSYDWPDDDQMGDKNAPKIKDFYTWSECDEIEHLNCMFSDSGFTVSEVPADGSDDEIFDENEYQFDGIHICDYT